MADCGEGGVGKTSSNIAELRKQVFTWAARNFEGTLEKPIDDDVSRLLAKRRKKWRKRHNLPPEVTSRPPDPALRSKKECLTDEYYQTGERLLACRKDGYELCRKLEKEKRRVQLQVAERYHQYEQSEQSEIVKQLPPKPSTSSEPVVTTSPSSIDQHNNKKLLKDLQRALSQVDALVKIKQMKLSMTPRLPPLHRREYNDNTSQNEQNEQFGMSLLVPPHQVVQSSPSPSLPPPPPPSTAPSVEAQEIVDVVDVTTNRGHLPLSKVLTSSDTCPGSGVDQEEEEEEEDKHNDSCTNEKSTKSHSEDKDCHMMNLDPAVELSPVNRDQDMNSIDEDDDDRGNLPGPYPEELPRIACVMSLMEGQDTASVVEVTADNDVVIETHSSLGSDENIDDITQPAPLPPEPTFDEERLMSTNILPEKEEIVSTTPDNYDDNVEELLVVDNIPTSSTTNHIASTTVTTTMTTQTETSLETNHKDTNHHQTAEEELVEMIMKDSELAAWIAKARLRPRTPISYSTSRKKRHSRSRSSSIHD